MIVFRREKPIEVSGRTIVAVSRVSVQGRRQNGLVLFSGDKRAVAVICRDNTGETIFDANGRLMSSSDLKAMMKGC